MDESPFGHASGYFRGSGRPEPDVSTWEGRMSMRAQTRAEMAALTEPPPDETPWEFGMCLHVDPSNPDYRLHLTKMHEDETDG
jgi:hypothetical protein